MDFPLVILTFKVWYLSQLYPRVIKLKYACGMVNSIRVARSISGHGVKSVQYPCASGADNPYVYVLTFVFKGRSLTVYSTTWLCNALCILTLCHQSQLCACLV